MVWPIRNSAIAARDGSPSRSNLGQASLEQADVRTEIGQRVLLEGVFKLAQRPQVPAQPSTVRAGCERFHDSQPAGHLSQLPRQVRVAAHQVHIEGPRLLGPSSGQGVRDGFFREVQRGGIGRQARSGPLDETDQLLADQVVPEPPFRGGCQLAEVIAHGRVDAHRLVGFAQDQVPPHQGRQHLLQFRRIERRQRAAGSPLLLEERAELSNPAEHSMLDREVLQYPLDRAKGHDDIRRGQVLAFPRGGLIQPAWRNAASRSARSSL